MRTMSDEKPVAVERKKGGVAVITLNNPPLNLQTLELMGQLEKAVMELNDDDMVRVVILTGTGSRAFSAGSDIKEFPQLSDNFVEKKLRRENAVFNRIQRIFRPAGAASSTERTNPFRTAPGGLKIYWTKPRLRTPTMGIESKARREARGWRAGDDPRAWVGDRLAGLHGGQQARTPREQEATSDPSEPPGERETDRPARRNGPSASEGPGVDGEQIIGPLRRAARVCRGATSGPAASGPAGRPDRRGARPR